MSPAAAAALRRSGSNSLSALLRAEEEEDDPPPAPAPAAAASDDGLAATKRRGGARRRSRSTLLRLPLAGAGGCRVCACDEAEPAPPRRRPLHVAGEDDPELAPPGAAVAQEVEERALQCFSWKKGPAVAVARRGRAQGAHDSASSVVVVTSDEEAEATTTLAALPDDVLEMVLGRLPLASLLAARCACRRWRDLTVAPQLLRLRREGPRAATTPWIFLFGVEGDGGWGGPGTAVVQALDVAAHRWRRVGAAALRGRSLFSVAGVGDELYVVGGRSGASTSAGSVKAKTHKGVMVYSPLMGAWRKAAPMRAARSRPVLGVFEMSGSRSVVHARAEKHVRRANAGGGKFRLGGTSAVYEDPHRLSLRRLRLMDVLSEDADSAAPAAHGHSKAVKREEEPAQARQALIAVGGRGPWDEPLVSGEIYDPLTDKWVEIAGFPADVGLACSGAVCGDTFYVYCESDTLVAYNLDAGSWSVVQTSRPPPPRLRDYAPALLCCASRLFMLCVSWCDPASRTDKVVRKVFELVAPSSSPSPLPQWAEASSHPDAPMDPNAAFAAGQDRIYAVEMFRIFGKVLDFATSCRVSDAAAGQSWSRVARKNAAAEADAMSCRLKSMAVLHL